MPTPDLRDENAIADAEISNALDADMATVVLEYMIEFGLTPARLRAALNDAITTAACEAAADEQIAPGPHDWDMMSAPGQA